MNLGLQDQVFIVTGGSRGLGFAAATELVADNAKVVVSSRSAESIKRATQSLGANSFGLVADNADPRTPDQLISHTLEKFGRLDGVLVSVGGPAPGSAMEASEDQWRAAFDSVFLGGLRMARTAATSMTRGGAIAFVLSSSVKMPVAGLAISNGLRPGLAMVAKTLADELGPRGIRVNGLLPGRLATERLLELDSLSGDAAAARARHEATIPLGRYGEPTEFGKVAAFLLSPASSYLTGVMLPVDGGLLRGL
jgi:3-oxoacyl-[acyl-carrier protein] reductase